MKSKVIIIVIIMMPIIYVFSCNRNKKPKQAAEVKFPNLLSTWKLFKGPLDSLHPADDVTNYQLASTLFTDYADKQRLIKLPKGTQLKLHADDLPIFPDGTILVKTFFYTRNKTGTKIIETRILILRNGTWTAGTYVWNAKQNEAHYTSQSIEVPVDFMGKNGQYRKINYRIPSKEDCASCHKFSETISPIGPKAMNLNRNVMVNGKEINQLQYFKEKGIFNTKENFTGLTRLPDYENTNTNLEHRARAYLEINCAHCHTPNGLAYRQSAMFDYKTPLRQSGIELNKNNILDRMSTMGPFHMPKTGTTIIHTEGLELIKKYIKNLPD